MKDLSTLLLENLVNEASQYKPKFKPQDWAKALKEINKGAYGNYSQLKGMEYLADEWGDYETADDWVEELYDDGEFDPKHEYKDILSDVAEFFVTYYSEDSWDYGDSQESIYYAKRDMGKADFGVEEENWYKFFTYEGPKNLEKYGKEIAKVGDCSYMDDMDELAEWYD